jgi:BASS family bile acid:Na+ symporter
MVISFDMLGTLLLRAGIVVIMLSMGLQITGEQLLVAIRQRRLMARVLLANLILLPLVALAIAKLTGMPDEIAAGFLIASVAPGATLTPKLAEIAHANLSIAVSVTFVMAILSIGTTPVLAGLFLPESMSVRFDPASVILILITFQLIPLIVGLAVHHWRPALARRLRRPSIQLSNVLFFAVVAFYVIHDFAAFKALPLSSVAAMVLMTCFSLVAGWHLGGPDKSTRQTLALGTSVEFTGLALLIATLSFPGTLAGVAVVAFGLIMVVINTATALIWKLRRPILAREDAVGSI